MGKLIVDHPDLNPYSRMRIQYQKNEAGLFVCPTCGATKEKQNTMFYHIKAHENVLPFQCKLCSKGFLQAQTLANHIAAKHSKGARATACPVCPYKAHQKSNVLRHFLRAHCPEELAKCCDTVSRPGTWVCRACEHVSQSNPAFTYHATGCIRLADPVLQGHLDALRGSGGGIIPQASQTSAKSLPDDTASSRDLQRLG